MTTTTTLDAEVTPRGGDAALARKSRARVRRRLTSDFLSLKLDMIRWEKRGIKEEKFDTFIGKLYLRKC